MSVTSTTSTVGAGLIGVTASAFIPGVDYPTVLGAFAGATLFVIINNDYSIIKKIALFFVSVIIGIYGSTFTVELINYLTPEKFPLAQRELGAVVAAASCVGVLATIIKLSKNPSSVLKRINGGDDDTTN